MTILTVTNSLSTHQGYEGDYDNVLLLTSIMKVTMTILNTTNSLSTHQGYGGDYDNSHDD